MSTVAKIVIREPEPVQETAFTTPKKRTKAVNSISERPRSQPRRALNLIPRSLFTQFSASK